MWIFPDLCFWFLCAFWWKLEFVTAFFCADKTFKYKQTFQPLIICIFNLESPASNGSSGFGRLWKVDINFYRKFQQLFAHINNVDVYKFKDVELRYRAMLVKLVIEFLNHFVAFLFCFVNYIFIESPHFSVYAFCPHSVAMTISWGFEKPHQKHFLQRSMLWKQREQSGFSLIHFLCCFDEISMWAFWNAFSGNNAFEKQWFWFYRIQWTTKCKIIETSEVAVPHFLFPRVMKSLVEHYFRFN